VSIVGLRPTGIRKFVIIEDFRPVPKVPKSCGAPSGRPSHALFGKTRRIIGQMHRLIGLWHVETPIFSMREDWVFSDQVCFERVPAFSGCASLMCMSVMAARCLRMDSFFTDATRRRSDGVRLCPCRPSRSIAAGGGSFSFKPGLRRLSRLPCFAHLCRNRTKERGHFKLFTTKCRAFRLSRCAVAMCGTLAG